MSSENNCVALVFLVVTKVGWQLPGASLVKFRMNKNNCVVPVFLI
jgi:hypothetical protein